MFQNKVLNEIITKYRENKLSHAYLIETNNINKAVNDIKSVIKVLNCPNEYQENCSNCNLCNLINKNNLPSLKIIEPDGSSIKKNQIEELKIDFGSIPIYSKYNTYIITNAEKLNPSSANSMLKFVEEPTNGIIGFFLTSNKDVMIDTIKSRCQILVLNYEANSIIEELSLTDEEYELYKKIIPAYLSHIFDHNTLNNKKLILSVFPEKRSIEKLLKIILSIYYQYFLKLLGKEYDSNLIELVKIDDNIIVIQKKLGVITKILQDLSYNVSIELILDRFVIEMRGVTNG